MVYSNRGYLILGKLHIDLYKKNNRSSHFNINKLLKSKLTARISTEAGTSKLSRTNSCT